MISIPPSLQGCQSAKPRLRLAAAAVLLAIALVALALWAWDPSVRPAAIGDDLNASGRRGVVGWREVLSPPPCPTWWFGGVYCAGCGALRAWHHLLHGRVGTALAHNAVSIVIVGVIVAWLGVGLLGVVLRGRWWGWGQRVAGRGRASRWLVWVVVWVILLWSVIRNVPGRAMEWSRPPPPAWATK